MAENSQRLVLTVFDRILDYPVYASWYERTGDIPPGLKDLPPNGFAVRKGNYLVACGFLFMTDADFSIFALWVGSPDASQKDVHMGFRSMIEAAKKVSINNGRNQIIVFTSRRGMIKLLLRHGFFNADGHLRWTHG